MRPSVDAFIWGRMLWDLLFVVALRGPNDGEDLITILASLEALIPCVSCRTSYQYFCKRFPLAKTSKADKIAPWLWTLKDYVNQKTRRKSRPYAEVKQMYSSVQQPISESALADLLVYVTLGMDDVVAPQINQFCAVISKVCVSTLKYKRLASLLENWDVTTKEEAVAKAKAIVLCVHNNDLICDTYHLFVHDDQRK